MEKLSEIDTSAGVLDYSRGESNKRRIDDMYVTFEHEPKKLCYRADGKFSFQLPFEDFIDFKKLLEDDSDSEESSTKSPVLDSKITYLLRQVILGNIDLLCII